MAHHYRTSENEVIVGGAEDDLIMGNGGTDELVGGGGDDTVVSMGNQLSGLSGNDGDDILHAPKVEFGQSHLFGGNGVDTLRLSAANEKTLGHHSHHAYGSAGPDIFAIEGEEMYLDLGDGHEILMTGSIEEEDPTANYADDFWDIFL